MKAQHKLPRKTKKWGYHHIPLTYGKKDPQWEAITGDGSVLAGLLRLISGYKTNKEVFSRGPDSWISLDTFSIGFAHWWAKTSPPIFVRVAQELPELTVWGYGEEAAEKMKSLSWLTSQIIPRKGKQLHDPRYDWLLCGWHHTSRHPAVIRICVEQWLSSYTSTVDEVMNKYGWSSARTQAGLYRVSNSRGSYGMKKLTKKAVQKTGTVREEIVIKELFEKADLYGKPDRWETICSWDNFEGARQEVTASSLNYYAGEILFTNGKVPGFVTVLDITEPMVICPSSS